MNKPKKRSLCPGCKNLMRKSEKKELCQHCIVQRMKWFEKMNSNLNKHPKVVEIQNWFADWYGR